MSLCSTCRFGSGKDFGCKAPGNPGRGASRLHHCKYFKPAKDPMLKQCPDCGYRPLVLKRLVVRARRTTYAYPNRFSREIVDVQVCPKCGFKNVVGSRPRN